MKRMFVNEAARGRGVGQALMRSIERAAQAVGVRLVRLEKPEFTARRRFGSIAASATSTADPSGAIPTTI